MCWSLYLVFLNPGCSGSASSSVVNTGCKPDMWSALLLMKPAYVGNIGFIYIVGVYSIVDLFEGMFVDI